MCSVPHTPNARNTLAQDSRKRGCDHPVDRQCSRTRGCQPREIVTTGKNGSARHRAPSASPPLARPRPEGRYLNQPDGSTQGDIPDTRPTPAATHPQGYTRSGDVKIEWLRFCGGDRRTHKKNNKMQQNKTKHHKTPQSTTTHHKTQQKNRKHHRTPQTQRNTTKHHRTPQNTTTHHNTPQNTMEHHKTHPPTHPLTQPPSHPATHPLTHSVIQSRLQDLNNQSLNQCSSRQLEQ